MSDGDRVIFLGFEIQHIFVNEIANRTIPGTQYLY